MNEKQKLVVIVRGVVQGVGFRQFTKKVAKRLGILGWVKNEDDGSVKIFAIGEKAAMDSFISQVRKGPASSQVNSLEQKSFDGETEIMPISFEVLR